MSRQTEMPRKNGCGNVPGWISPKGNHKWDYGTSWNGNDRKVLPFWSGTTGVARSGWRCFHCGRMEWDVSDQMFAASFAVAVGIVKLPKCVPVNEGELVT